MTIETEQEQNKELAGALRSNGWMTKSEIISKYGGSGHQWSQHSNGGGWVNTTHAEVPPQIYVGEDAVIVGGKFFGGEFWGGTFFGGTFWGGTFLGGKFWGGTFQGGTFFGGKFLGGKFLGGTFQGGEFRETPLQVAAKYYCTWCAPGVLCIGCEMHTIEAWQHDLPEIIGRHNEEDENYWRKIIELYASDDSAPE